MSSPRGRAAATPAAADALSFGFSRVRRRRDGRPARCRPRPPPREAARGVGRQGRGRRLLGRALGRAVARARRPLGRGADEVARGVAVVAPAEGAREGVELGRVPDDVLLRALGHAAAGALEELAGGGWGFCFFWRRVTAKGEGSCREQLGWRTGMREVANGLGPQCGPLIRDTERGARERDGPRPRAPPRRTAVACCDSGCRPRAGNPDTKKRIIGRGGQLLCLLTGGHEGERRDDDEEELVHCCLSVG